MTVQKWDRHAIRAEVHRKGLTLTGIALDAGLAESACRRALLGMSRPGALALADALGIPFRTLFPDLYSRGRHNEDESGRNERIKASAKAQPAADDKAAAA